MTITADAPAMLTSDDLVSMADAALAEAYNAGLVTLADLESECERRDRAARDAARSRRRQAALKAEWYEAAYAQYLAAEAACNGFLLSRLGDSEGIESPMVLWTGREDWAMQRASWELQEFWAANGGRQSAARWRDQQAMARRAERDARDLAAMDAAGPAAPVWDAVPGGDVAETAVRVDGAMVPAYWARDAAGDITLHRSRELAVASLAAVRPALRLVPPAPVRSDTAAAYATAMAGIGHLVKLTARQHAGRAAVLAQLTARRTG